MTLMNGLTIGARAFLWSDTAYFSPDGKTCLGCAPKAMLGLTWPFAVAWTSSGSNPLNVLPQRIGWAYPQDLPDLLKVCRLALRDFCEKPGDVGRLLVAAWDADQRRARLFRIASDSVDVPPFTPEEATTALSSGAGVPAVLEPLSRGHTVAAMRKAIDAQQANPEMSVLDGTVCTIGGELIEIEVTRHGATSRVLKDWGTGLAI